MSWLDAFFGPGDATGVLGGVIVDQRNLSGVVTTPGWEVIGSFQVAASGAITLSANVLCGTGLTTRVKLVRQSDLTDVASSTLSSSANVPTVVSASVALVANTVYQVQAETTGGGAPTDISSVYSVSVK